MGFSDFGQNTVTTIDVAKTHLHKVLLIFCEQLVLILPGHLDLIRLEGTSDPTLFGSASPY